MPEPSRAARPLTSPLQLAVDARDLARDRRGIGTYVRTLLGRFARRDDVQLTFLVRHWLPQRAAAEIRDALELDTVSTLRCANRIPRDADAVWHPWNGTFFGGPAPAVATIHDVVAFALPPADPARRDAQQAPIRRSAQTARAIICDSRFTAGEVQRYLGVEPARVQTVELGVDPVFSPGPLEALPPSVRGRRYILHVGAHDAHKNVATLAAAHRSAFPDGDAVLVFTRRNPLVPEALVFEDVDRATLVALYRGATVVAVPSLYEGFGLPVLEAMACGAPVLAARAAALPEVGGEVIRYVDEPRNVDAWRLALRALCSDTEARATMARRGPLRAATFRWERCAERTLEIIRTTVAHGTAGTP